MTGWIKIHRDLMNKPIWHQSTPEQKVVLVSLLLMVNHQENEWEWEGQPYKVKPGQVITSLESIVKKCGKGVSVQNVRTALKRFEKYGFLTNKSTNKNRLITIVNWEKYQGKNSPTNNQPNKQPTNNQQPDNMQLTPNNNYKEIKKNEKKRLYW